MKRSANTGLFAFTGLLAWALLVPPQAFAHCDGIDGPVVKAAQQALATGNVNLVLIWIKDQDASEVHKVFAKTLAVRDLSPEARELADLYFFEAVVRIHRAGEGEPYAGLQPAGRDLGPAIPAADKAIERGSLDELVTWITSESTNGIRERFQKVTAAKKFSADDVRAARGYVKAYVEFVHYVEGLHESAQRGGDEHAESAVSRPERWKRSMPHSKLSNHLSRPSQHELKQQGRNAMQPDTTSKPKGLSGAEVAKPAELVNYQDGAVVSREIIKKPAGSVTIFAFDEGEGLSEHTAPFDALVQIVEGNAEVMIAGQPHQLQSGEMILMPAGQPHALKALKRFRMILTMIRS